VAYWFPPRLIKGKSHPQDEIKIMGSSHVALHFSQQVIKRSGKRETFNPDKIQSAIRKCSNESTAAKLTNKVMAALPATVAIPIERIQDTIVQVLTDTGNVQEAAKFQMYREHKALQRQDRPIDALTQEKFDSNRQYFKTPLQLFQYYDKYARWMPKLNRRETWPETVERVMSFLKKNCTRTPFEQSEWDQMEGAMLSLDVLPSLRVVQMAGPALERCNVGAYNCSYCVIDNIDAFSELLYVLMCGTGGAYSVEDRYVSRLPRVKKQRNIKRQKYLVDDSTEGWCNALKTGLHAWFSGTGVEFDYTQIRPAGALLKTKGGTASGHVPLKNLLDFTRKIVLARQGRALTSVDCHDICCYCGWIVQVGGVRRAALLSLSDLDDKEMAECKTGEFWREHPHRAMSNNSCVFEEKPTARIFMEEWLNLAKSGTGERGIFNRSCIIPERRTRDEFGCNACGEIKLRNKGFCNLSVCVARKDDTFESLSRKVRIATMFGTAQATLTYFPYLSEGWETNCLEEMLLGVDITGQRDCELLRRVDAGVFFAGLRFTAIETNRILSERFGLPQSVAVTCVKPSGNSAQLLDCSSGVHVRYAPYYIRRVRTGVHSPVSQLLKDTGVPHYPETGMDAETATVLVFEFPVKSPEGAVCRNNVTARDQFEYWLMNQRDYAEHSVSCTIYVGEDEWLDLGARVYENWDYISGLSFLPKEDDGHVYPLAPYEDITSDEYEKRVRAFPDINWAKLCRYEQSDETSQALDFSCVSGVCEL